MHVQFEIFTNGRWIHIKKIIRHKVKNQKLIRINAHSGLVDVTPNHSIYIKNGNVEGEITIEMIKL